MTYLRISFVTLTVVAVLMTGLWAQEQTTTTTETPAQQRQAAREAAREAAKEKAAERKAAKTQGAAPAAKTAPVATHSTAKAASAPPATTSAAAPSDSRGAVSAPGIGTFKSGWFTLTAYGCFRSGTRLLCDFDATRQQSGQIKNVIWGSVHLVDDGGKITARHNAFFMGDDGSQFNTAYLSTAPVRFIMEYDNVAANVTSISLVNGKDRMQGVPITNVAQTTGVPQRGAVAATGTPRP